MTKLGIKTISAERAFVTFTCSRSFAHGNKGYKFWPMNDGLHARPPGTVVSSLDGDLPGNNSLFLRKIDDGWFLFVRVSRE